jgi:ribosomal protein S6--L-glutamate ligase
MRLVLISEKPANYTHDRLISAGAACGIDARTLHPAALALEIARGGARVIEDGRPSAIDIAWPRSGALTRDHTLAVVRALAAGGTRIVNGIEGLSVSRDKIATLLALAQAGIRVPKTVLIRRPALLPDALSTLGGYPIVAKLPWGMRGMGVFLIENPANLDSLAGLLWNLDRDVLLQECIKESLGRDTRIFILGGEVAGAIERTAAPGDFRANLFRGATASACDPTREMRELAVQATRVLKLEIAGIDIMRGSQGPVVIEANAAPGIEGIERATGMDLAGRIMSYISASHRGS